MNENQKNTKEIDESQASKTKDIKNSKEPIQEISINEEHRFEYLESNSDCEEILFKDELDLRGKIEAILFASPNSLKVSEISELLLDESVSNQNIIEIAEGLMRFYQEKGSGFQLVHQKGKGYQFQTVPAASYLMERLFSQRPRPLSRAAHETLAIVAYRQPVTRADIEFIRGVDSGSIIKNLVERDLVKCVGRKEDTPGKPMIFGTSIEFLKTYRLKSLSQLPPLESFQPSPETLEKAIQTMDKPDGVDVEELLIPKDNYDNNDGDKSLY